MRNRCRKADILSSGTWGEEKFWGLKMRGQNKYLYPLFSEYISNVLNDGQNTDHLFSRALDKLEMTIKEIKDEENKNLDNKDIVIEEMDSVKINLPIKKNEMKKNNFEGDVDESQLSFKEAIRRILKNPISTKPCITLPDSCYIGIIKSTILNSKK